MTELVTGEANCNLASVNVAPKLTVTYHTSREYVASYPHGVLAFRLSADQPGKLNAKFSLSRSQWVLSQTASVNDGDGGHTVALSANSGQSSDAITFWSEARIVNSGGT